LSGAGFIPAAVAARQKRIIRKFEEAGATSAEHARTAEELDVRDRHLFSRLVKAEVLQSPGEGRYFLSAEGLQRWKQRRLVAVFVALGAVIAGAAIALAFARG
jgi:hypothetical protein